MSRNSRNTQTSPDAYRGGGAEPQSETPNRDAAWQRVNTLWNAATNSGDPEARRESYQAWHEATRVAVNTHD